MCIYHLTCINKVRAYIDEVKMLSSSAAAKSKKENNFHLSKSLSMSNLAAEEERKQLQPNSSGSSSNLSRMKAFISTSHLEDLRITLRRNEVRMRVMCSNF